MRRRGNVAFVIALEKRFNLKIDPKAIDPNDPEMLEDMILAAVNEAVRSAHSLMESKLGGLAGGALGGLGLPGLGE